MYKEMTYVTCRPFCLKVIVLTYKQREMHVCVLRTEAIDALVLEHQAISIKRADYICIVLDLLHAAILHLLRTA